MHKDSWMDSIDLKDAYYHVPMNQQFKNVLVVRANQKLRLSIFFHGLNFGSLEFHENSKASLKDIDPKPHRDKLSPDNFN